MHLDITVWFHSALAHYSVLKEAEGIYLAVLQYYEGHLDHSPPERIVLIKGMRSWTGSFAHPELLNDIGTAIEKATAAQPS